MSKQNMIEAKISNDQNCRCTYVHRWWGRVETCKRHRKGD